MYYDHKRDDTFNQEYVDLLTEHYHFSLRSSGLYREGVDKYLDGAMVYYFDYTGTTDQTPEQLAAELYRLACNVRVSVGGNRTRVNISGLQENMVEAIRFAENWLANCVGDEAVLEGLKADRMRSRANAKLGQSQNQSALQNYVAFGPEYIRLTTLTDAQLMGAKSDELLAKVKNLITAGRCTSVTDSMWDIMRVIPCCAVTGEAAGTAAAMTDDFTTLDIAQLQAKLASNGVVIHERDL